MSARCRLCGCSVDLPCIGGCHRVEADLCSSCRLPIPIVTNGAIKELHLRDRPGWLLVGHPYTDMTSSFMIKLDGNDQLLQCGAFEFRQVGGLDRDPGRSSS